MVTMAQALTNVRSQVDELNTTNQYWGDPELRQWINEGVRSVARRTETILVYNATLAAIVNQAKYNLPPDVIRVHRITFQPTNSIQEYPITGSTYDELDMLWGINPQQTASYPSVFCVWGTPGAMTVQFYPVPAQTGIFNIFYYGMPADLDRNGGEDAKQLVIPSGWDDIITLFVTYRAKIKAKDPDWQIAKGLFEDELQHLVDVTRQAHDQGRYMQTATSTVPQWLYAFEDM